MTAFRPKGTIEAWQVPVEKDGRRKLPEWIQDWFPGRTPEEPALVLVKVRDEVLRVSAMATEWLIPQPGEKPQRMAAADFAEQYEPMA